MDLEEDVEVHYDQSTLHDILKEFTKYSYKRIQKEQKQSETEILAQVSQPVASGNCFSTLWLSLSVLIENFQRKFDFYSIPVSVVDDCWFFFLLMLFCDMNSSYSPSCFRTYCVTQRN